MQISTSYNNGGRNLYNVYSSISGAGLVRGNYNMRRDSVFVRRNPMFQSVTLKVEMLTARYGTRKYEPVHINHGVTRGCKEEKEWKEVTQELLDKVVLPEAYTFKQNEEDKYYYHGRTVNSYELIQIAVCSGKMELKEGEAIYSAAQRAFDCVIQGEAKPQYSYSSTLYSEDGKYTFVKQKDGTYKWNFVEDEAMEFSVEEIANLIASGVPNRNIEKRYLHYLQKMDPELYEAANQIRKEMNTYAIMEHAYKAGELSLKQHEYDLDLLAYLFGKKGNKLFQEKYKQAQITGDFTWFLEHYNQSRSDALQEIRIEQTMRYGGIV